MKRDPDFREKAMILQSIERGAVHPLSAADIEIATACMRHGWLTGHGREPGKYLPTALGAGVVGRDFADVSGGAS